MESLSQQIMKSRTISKSSLDTYLRNVKVMMKALSKEKEFSLKFLQDFSKVKKYLMDQKDSTRKNKLATILVVLKLKPKENKTIIEKYGDFLFEQSKLYEDKIKEHKKSLYQSENWVSLEDLTNVFNTYKKQVFSLNLHKKDKKILNTEEKEILQKFLVSALYTLIPPRRNRDYAEMDVLTEDAYNQLPIAKKEKNNFLVIKNKNNMFFSFADYKTKKTFGIQIHNITGKLLKVINIWSKFNLNSKHLLYNNRKQKMSPNSLTKFLMKIFSITGKNGISSTMIRHIYDTEKKELIEYREAKKKAESIASDMAHSLETQQDYVKDK